MYLYTKSGFNFKWLESDEAKTLEKGEKILIGIWEDEEHKSLRLDSAVITKAAYYNADCDEPGWEIETTNGVVDLNSIFQKVE